MTTGATAARRTKTKKTAAPPADPVKATNDHLSHLLGRPSFYVDISNDPPLRTSNTTNDTTTNTTANTNVNTSTANALNTSNASTATANASTANAPTSNASTATANASTANASTSNSTANANTSTLVSSANAPVLAEESALVAANEPPPMLPVPPFLTTHPKLASKQKHIPPRKQRSSSSASNSKNNNRKKNMPHHRNRLIAAALEEKKATLTAATTTTTTRKIKTATARSIRTPLSRISSPAPHSNSTAGHLLNAAKSPFAMAAHPPAHLPRPTPKRTSSMPNIFDYPAALISDHQHYAFHNENLAHNNEVVSKETPPLDKVCAVCGEFIIVGCNNQVQPIHYSLDCPLMHQPARIASVLQSLNASLAAVPIETVIQHPTYQRLVFRKGLLECILAKLNVHVTSDTASVFVDPFSQDALQTLLNVNTPTMANESVSQPKNDNIHPAEDNLLVDEQIQTIETATLESTNPVDLKVLNDQLDQMLLLQASCDPLSIPVPAEPLSIVEDLDLLLKNVSKELPHPEHISETDLDKFIAATSLLPDETPQVTNENDSMRRVTRSSKQNSPISHNENSALLAANQFLIEDLFDNLPPSESHTEPVAERTRAKNHQENDDAYNVFSDTDYLTFIDSLQRGNATPYSAFDEDRDDPTDIGDELIQDDAEEYRDDDEVKVTLEELNDLIEEDFEKQAEDLTFVPSIDLPVRVRQMEQEEPTVPGTIFSVSQMVTLKKQLAQNFQLIMQNMVLSKELSGLNSEPLTYWTNQLSALLEMRKSVPYAMLRNAVCNIPGLERAVNVWMHISVLPTSSSFRDACKSTSAKQRSSEKRVQAPNSLRLLLIRFADIFHNDLVPVIQPVSNPSAPREFSEAEDRLVLHGLRLFGTKKWDLIQRYMLPVRSEEQIEARYKNCTGRLAGPNPIKDFYFSQSRPLLPKEQELLIQGIQLYGENFSRISKVLLPHKPPVILQRAWRILNRQQLHQPTDLEPRPMLKRSCPSDTSSVNDAKRPRAPLILDDM